MSPALSSSRRPKLEQMHKQLSGPRLAQGGWASGRSLKEGDLIDQCGKPVAHVLFVFLLRQKMFMNELVFSKLRLQVLLQC